MPPGLYIHFRKPANRTIMPAFSANIEPMTVTFTPYMGAVGAPGALRGAFE